MWVNDNWGLTDKGFYRPTYTVLLNALEYKARELYGDGINLTVRSPLGVFLRILAWIWNILFACLCTIAALWTQPWGQAFIIWEMQSVCSFFRKEKQPDIFL
jgi:hypothetical protein